MVVGEKRCGEMGYMGTSRRVYKPPAAAGRWAKVPYIYVHIYALG